MHAFGSSLPVHARFRGFAWVRPRYVALPLYLFGVMGGAALLSWKTLHGLTAILIVGWLLWGIAGAMYVYWIAGPSTRIPGHGQWNRVTGVVQWHTETQALDGVILRIERGYPESKRATRWILGAIILLGVLDQGIHHALSAVGLWGLSNLVVVSVANWMAPVYRWVIHVQGATGRTKLLIMQIDTVMQMDTDFPPSA